MKDKQKNPNAVRLGQLRWKGVSKEDRVKHMKNCADKSPMTKPRKVLTE